MPHLGHGPRFEVSASPKEVSGKYNLSSLCNDGRYAEQHLECTAIKP